MKAENLVIPGQLAYLWTPADEIRGFVDGLFPYLAKCPVADIATGAGHRFKTGHDLFIDVSNTFAKQGLGDAAHQTGHIVLTDFPTKAGIPIPGLSESGLGEWLIKAGIPKGWLSVNLCDAGVSVLAIPESASDLLNAIGGAMTMNTATFFDTFGEGSLEIALALTLPGNPLPLGIAGITNILAGVVATVNTFVVHVDPITFFGSSLSSALIGFAVGQGLSNKSLTESMEIALRGGTVGALFSISAPFGFGAICAFLAYRGGKALKEQHRRLTEENFVISGESAMLFFEEAKKLSPWIDTLINAPGPDMLSADAAMLCSTFIPLKSTPISLINEHRSLDSTFPLLKADIPELESILTSFSEDLSEPP